MPHPPTLDEVSLPTLGCPQARTEFYVQAFRRPHCHSHLPLYGASRCKAKLVSLGDHRQKQRSFYQRQVVPYALVLAGPEGNIRQVVVKSFALVREALRFEAGWP